MAGDAKVLHPRGCSGAKLTFPVRDEQTARKNSHKPATNPCGTGRLNAGSEPAFVVAERVLVNRELSMNYRGEAPVGTVLRGGRDGLTRPTILTSFPGC